MYLDLDPVRLGLPNRVANNLIPPALNGNPILAAGTTLIIILWCFTVNGIPPNDIIIPSTRHSIITILCDGVAPDDTVL